MVLSMHCKGAFLVEIEGRCRYGGAEQEVGKKAVLVKFWRDDHFSTSRNRRGGSKAPRAVRRARLRELGVDNIVTSEVPEKLQRELETRRRY